jgi:hypothetical protein
MFHKGRICGASLTKASRPLDDRLAFSGGFLVWAACGPRAVTAIKKVLGPGPGRDRCADAGTSATSSSNDPA